jgi:hypothetical protein
MLLHTVLILCQRNHKFSHCLETRGILFQLIIVSSLPIASESCIIVANMANEFLLQISQAPDAY